MNVPLIVIKASREGLGLYTPVRLTGLHIMYEAETEDGDILMFAPEELGAHPGCADPYECFMQIYRKGHVSDCSRCEEQNKLQLEHIDKLMKLIKVFMVYLKLVVKEAIEGVYQ